MEVEVETEGEDKEPVRMAPVDMLDDGYGGESLLDTCFQLTLSLGNFSHLWLSTGMRMWIIFQFGAFV